MDKHKQMDGKRNVLTESIMKQNEFERQMNA